MRVNELPWMQSSSAPALDGLRALEPYRVLNMSTGPVHVSNAVLRSQLDAHLSSHTPGFWTLYDETVASVRRILRTEFETLIVHGSIRIGIDLALGNLIAPGTKVLALVNGFWGHYIADNAKAYGANVVRIESSMMDPFDPQLVSDALRAHRDVEIVIIVHVETNSGVVNPIEAIGRVVQETDAIFMVDTACSAGAIPLETDAWGVDVGVTGSHKTLGGLPGLAVLSVSPKAWSKIDEHPERGRLGHLNLRQLFDANLKRGRPPGYTQPTSLVQALRAATREIETFGLDNWFGMHDHAAALLRSSLRTWGFKLVTDDARVAAGKPLHEGVAASVLAFMYPVGIDDAAFRKTLEDDYGVFVIGNVGELDGKSFRIGLMSSVQIDPRVVQATSSAIVAAASRLKSKETHEGAQ